MIVCDEWPEPFEPAVFFRMTDAEYLRQREAVSASRLRGMLSHTAVEPHPLASVYKRAIEDPLAFEHGELLPDAFDLIRAMADAVRACDDAALLLRAPGFNDVSMAYVDRETRLQCKLRVDRWLPEDRLMVSFKIVPDASEEGFAHYMDKRLHGVTHAHYIEGVASLAEEFPGGWAIDGAWDNVAPLKPVEHFLHIVQESVPPYAVAVRKTPDNAVRWGHAERSKALAMVSAWRRDGA